MNALRRLAWADSGQAIVEVAIVAPLLILFLIGVIDLGRLAQFDAALTSSARAGAQYGALNLENAQDFTGMQTAAKNDAPSISGLSVVASNFCKCADGSSAACTASACSSNHRLLYVSVTSTATFKPLFKYFVNTATSHSRTAILEVGQ